MTFRFHLERTVDEGGVSGTGHIADGVVFDDGWTVLKWVTAHKSIAFYTALRELYAIHGHGGKTKIVWDEPCCLKCKHPLEMHWGDNCGACMFYLYGVESCDCVIMNHEKECLPPKEK